MKNLSKNFKILLTCGVISFAAASLSSKQVTLQVDDREPLSLVADQDEEQSQVDLDELEFLEMINSVPLDEKSAATIRKFQEKEGRNQLYNKVYNPNNHCTVETYRNKEVLLITIPASSLFAPNDTNLLPSAATLLTPLKRYLSEPDFYRVLMVMHTDNTGSAQYRDNLTEKRSNAVFEWFANQGLNTEFLFPYAFGDDDPLVENNSMSNRNKNRRLEIYLVPGTKMLEQAKKGRIAF